MKRPPAASSRSSIRNRSQPVTRDEYIIGRLVNGDQVEVVGSVNVSPDPKVVNHVWVYAPGLKISGWVNSRYIQ